ncbi:5727_t:CDS:2 [Ambispora leptoticha]|uniref:5727_t:CDS:1 n=1 Tax=Ambispora leptoticha TaxID=144679 RepID=A0A9N9AJP5_9GLOM|nr:5727_t:CDS:2 [Ambispora leptoticha]
MEHFAKSIDITTPSTKSNWTVIICFFLTLYITRFYYRYFTRPDKCPGPIPLPLVGNLFQLQRIEKIHHKLHQRYGDIFEMYMGSERYVFFNRGGGDLFDKIASNSTKSKYFNRLPKSENLENLGLEKSGIVVNRDPSKLPASQIKHSEGFNKNIMDWPISLFYIAWIPSWIRHYVPVFSHFDRKCKNNLMWLKNEMESIITRTRNEINDNNEKVLAKNDLLTLLMTETVKNDKTASPSIEEISETIIEVCVTGTDKIAATFCFLIYCLDRNPHIKEELLREFKNVLGEDICRSFTYADLEKMRYCEAVVKETLRLMPTVPFIPKVANEDDEINQCKIKAETTIWLNVQQAHLADWYNPTEFNPSRFLNDSSENDKS